MAHQQYEAGLEPARQDYPEVTQGYVYGHHHHQLPQPYHPHSHDNLISTTPPKQDATAWGSTTAASPYSSAPQPGILLVFVLSCIIAFLAAAVVGLAAATGVQAQRASSAESDLAALKASMGGNTSPSDGSTTNTVIDDGCSENPGS
ncbi:hypothetical protein VTH82DRAFT_4317, partial [Thermothelomyces myriococcoides]